MDKAAALHYAGGTFIQMTMGHHEHHEHEREHHLEEVDREAIETFWTQELKELPERNRRLAAEHQAEAAERARRQSRRLTVAATCMDERTAFTEEALGLLPGEGEVYGSGGARIDVETFEKLYGRDLKRAATDGKETEICLVTHKCAGDSHKGCAAFANDVEKQTEYFGELQDKLARLYPETRTSVLMLDSTAYGLERITADPRDARLAEIMKKGGGLKGFRAKEEAHAGYGIFIGDAYRAWVPEHNTYFRLSALNPDVVGNVGIALNVMEHHSTVDLSKKPIVLHADYPEYEDRERSAEAKKAIDAALKAVTELPTVAAKIAAGSLKIVKSATNMETWEGKLL